MIFFGVGTKKLDIALGPNQFLRVARGFFHIMFIFTATGKRKFVLAQQGETGWAYRLISEHDAAQLCGGTAPDISYWWRFSLLGAIAFGILCGALAAIF